jgi:nucleoid-associated protein YgaU
MRRDVGSLVGASPTLSGRVALPVQEGTMGDKKPDFSNVTGGASSKPRDDRPDFSDVKGGANSTAETADRTYEVVPGDTLSAIAKREYGNAGEWRRIFEANRDVISDPDRIYPGQKLRIPRK